MLTRSVNAEVLYPDEKLVHVAQTDMSLLKEGALKSARNRMRLCAHRSSADSLHEMLIVLTAQTYIPPHRHRNKCESFHVIEGQGEIVLFDDIGNVTNIIPMGDYASGSCFYYRVADPVYHTVRMVSPVFMFHETTNGPFSRADTEFAAWAPPESDPAAGIAYLEQAIASFAS